VTRILPLAFAALFALPATAAAQLRPPPLLPMPEAPTLQEHASGGEVPLVIGAASVIGLMAYDVATAPSSARRYNRANPLAFPKSPTTALLLSAAATAVPIGAGVVAVEQGADAGALLVMAGIAAGPGAGHWYAGRRARALQNTGLRAALLLGSLYVEQCCT
jgi:hypothetical protein